MIRVKCKFLSKSFLYTLLHDLLGVNKSIVYTIGARVIQAIGGVFILYFVAKYLSVVEQGYYYTFGSILALQVFFELGLSGVLSQYAAHEVAHLSWKEGAFEGSDYHIKRLSSLLRFSFKWFSAMAIILFVALLICGFLFFGVYTVVNSHVGWKYPWVLLVFTSSLNLLVTPVLSYFEGLGKILEVARLRFFQQFFSIICVWSVLTMGGGLFATGVATLTTFVIALFWLLSERQYILLKSIWRKFDSSTIIDWKTEILPYQWKIALSWISGYLSFQIFNPVLFAVEGSVIAGKMGMTLAVLSGVTSLALSWINTKIPYLSSLIALKKYDILNSIFSRTLKQGCFICLFALIVFIGGLKILNIFDVNWGIRFLSFDLVILLSLVTFSNIIVFFLAVYLRCFKKEPYLYMSLVMGISTTLSTVFLGHWCGIYGIVVGYFCLSLFMYLPWSIVVFINKKNEWCK